MDFASVTGDDSDFLVIPASEWVKTRDALFTGFQRLKEIAANTSIHQKSTQFGDTIEVLLLRCALHTSYHVGQIVLLRQLL